jgi:hypothetical protein
VFNGTGCDDSTRLFNTTLALPATDGVCENIVNTTAYATVTCLSSSSSSSGGGSKSCFSGSESVMMSTGESKLIADVAVGDIVLAATKSGNLVYSPVIAVPHGSNSEPSTFVHLVTRNGADLKLTADHLILSGPCSAGISEYLLVQAKDVNVGHCLSYMQQSAQVVHVGGVFGRGKYTIVTETDYVVVNGFVASSFAANHAAANAYYTVYRFLKAVLPTQVFENAWVLNANEVVGSLFAQFASF